MNMKKILKGFTLIELLIVIAIIGVLAVAFLPTLLGAPSKGRDAARIADLQKIQKVLVNLDLEGVSYPTASDWTKIDGSTFNSILPALGGVLPTDPQPDKDYWYKTDVQYPSGEDTTTYSFALVALVENFDNANANCTISASPDFIVTGDVANLGAPQPNTSYCYVILAST
jgi:prepilin-type N-terminal cleavage/methylation domain-containing protein